MPWYSRAPRPVAAYGPALAAPGNGRLYAAGGDTGSFVSSANHEYDPVSDTWTTRASMPQAKYLSAFGAPGNGRFYVVTGLGPSYSTVATNHEYDPQTNTWASRASIPTARFGAAGATAGGLLYVVAGFASTYRAENEAYDPSTNTWATRAAVPTARYGPAATSGSPFYVVGGEVSGSYLTTNQSYDPSANTWTTRASMTTGRYFLAAGLVSGRVFAAGGYNGSILSTNQRYDPSSNSWTSATSMPTARYGTGYVVLDDVLYVVGGFSSGGLTAAHEAWDTKGLLALEIDVANQGFYDPFGALGAEVDQALAGAPRVTVHGSQVVEEDVANQGSFVHTISGSTAVEMTIARPGTEAAARRRRLTATVRDVGSPHLVVCSLTTDSDRNFEIVAGDAGAGDLVLHMDEAETGCLDCNKIVALSLDGEPIGAFTVESAAFAAVPRDGTVAGRTVRVSGRSTLALLERAIVYPELGARRMSPATRLMNWTSAAYTVSPPWTAAVRIKRQGDVTGQWDGAPMDWPDPDAYWIWAQPQGSGTPPQPVGTCYFRTTFFLPRQTPVTVFVTADDGYELYLDATLVAQETRAFMWAETRTVNLLLDAGVHTIAIAGINIFRDSQSTNVAGVICTVVERTEGGQSFGDVIVHTDETWSALAYPPEAPGMNPGQVMRVLLAEAQARGTLTGVTPLFGDRYDSLGNPWAITTNLELQVGTSLLQVARMLAELGVEVEMLSAEYLSMWPRGAMDLSATVHLTETDVHEMSFEMACPVTTILLAAWHTGELPADFTTNDAYVEHSCSSCVSAFGRREAFASLGSAASADQTVRSIEAILRDNGQRVVTAEGEVVLRAADGTDVVGPFVVWRPGAWISVDTPVLGPWTLYRVTQLSVSDDPSGGPDPVIRFRAQHPPMLNTYF